MNCKTDQIRAAWAAGDRVGALRVAARFFDRSADTKAFKRGMDAHNNPGFYSQLGKDPEQQLRWSYWRRKSGCSPQLNPNPVLSDWWLASVRYRADLALCWAAVARGNAEERATTQQATQTA